MINIRRLYRDDDKIADAQEDIDIESFGGVIPNVGDRVIEMLKGKKRAYRVVERIFEYGSSIPYINLVMDEVDMEDLAEMDRFSLRY